MRTIRRCKVYIPTKQNIGIPINLRDIFIFDESFVVPVPVVKPNKVYYKRTNYSNCIINK